MRNIVQPVDHRDGNHSPVQSHLSRATTAGGRGQGGATEDASSGLCNGRNKSCIGVTNQG